MKKIYLAGPDVFYPNSIEIGKEKKRLCKEYGFEGLYPMDNEIDFSGKTGKEIATEIYEGNMKMIKDADLGIFNLRPFRGPSADVGTVFELGCFTALGKPRFSYTDNAYNYAERVKKFYDNSLRETDGKLYDPEGLSTEDFDESDNLMIDGSMNWNNYFADPFYFENDFYDGFISCLKDAKRYYENFQLKTFV